MTDYGRSQAEDLGNAFRKMYPSNDGKSDTSFLRLHSTYRHDLKIYASDEGRVQMTAAAFAKVKEKQQQKQNERFEKKS